MCFCHRRFSCIPFFLLLVIDLGLCGHSGKLNQVFDLKENSLVVALVVRKKKNRSMEGIGRYDWGSKDGSDCPSGTC